MRGVTLEKGAKTKLSKDWDLPWRQPEGIDSWFVKWSCVAD